MFKTVWKWMKSHPYLTAGLIGAGVVASGGTALLYFSTLALGVKIAIVATAAIASGAASASSAKLHAIYAHPVAKKTKAKAKLKPKPADIELSGFSPFNDYKTPKVLRIFFDSIEENRGSPTNLDEPLAPVNEDVEKIMPDPLKVQAGNEPMERVRSPRL